jgi:RNA-binding protein
VPKKAAKKKAAPKKRKPSPPPVPLTGKHKSHLRALAHPLKPVVQIGKQGLSDAVLTALDVALERHELIKVKVSGESELDAAELAPKIAKATRGQVAQIIGRTLVLYRRRAENPKIQLPKAKPKAAARPSASSAAREEDDYGPDDDDDAVDDEDDEDDLEEDDPDDEDEDQDEDLE